MIPSASSYDDEVLHSAFANISLIADRTWTYDRGDLFQRLNQLLWIQNCKLVAKYKENGNHRRKRVRDVIPESLLAKYGNYEYNEDREDMYKPSNNRAPFPLPIFHPGEATEPWMFAEVEENFARLTSPLHTQAANEFSAIKGLECNSGLRESGVRLGMKSNWNSPASYRNKGQGNYYEPSSVCKETDKEFDEFKQFSPRCYSVESEEELQLQLRLCNDSVRDLWDTTKSQQSHTFAGSRGSYCRPDHQKQQTRVTRCDQSNVTQSNQHWPKYSVVNSGAQGRQQQFYCTVQCQPVILRTEYQSARSETFEILRKPLPPALSAEVPEFFPKVHPTLYFNGQKDRKGHPIQYFPSSFERSYQNELFPYNRAHELTTAAMFQNPGIPIIPRTDTGNYVHPPQQWVQRVGPLTQMVSSVSQPICNTVQPIRSTTVAQHPVQMHEKFLPLGQTTATSIPVYQRPMELYQDTGQRRKNQGVDFNNLILLTKSAFKSRRSRSKSRQQNTGYSLESRKQEPRREDEGGQSYEKGHSKKKKDILTVNTLVSELRSFEDKCGHGKSGTRWKVSNALSKPRTEEVKENTVTTKGRTESKLEGDRRSKKRLYRDVLTNASSTRIVLDNVHDKRYDELELQAMEQYRTSEESLALQYQELERQALEQYRNTGSTQASSTSLSSAIGKQSRENSFPSEDRYCVDGHKCSGFGRCSPAKQSPEKPEKGPFPQPQFTLLRAETKYETSNLRQSVNRKNVRPVIVSKSVTQLAQEIFQGSKNISKGASGDRIDKTGVGASTKRRLILMSPFKRETEARLMKSATSEEIHSSLRLKNTNSYRRTSEILRIGGGDENIKILPSSSTKVWLSGFWTS